MIFYLHAWRRLLLAVMPVLLLELFPNPGDCGPHLARRGAAYMVARRHRTFKRQYGEHVIAGRFSKRTQVWIDLAGFFIFLMPACLLILWYGVPFALISIQSQEMSSNAGGLIVWPAKLLVPLGFALLVLQGISEIIKRIAFLAGRIDGHEFAKHVATPQDEIDAIKAANKID